MYVILFRYNKLFFEIWSKKQNKKKKNDCFKSNEIIIPFSYMCYG